MKIETLIQKTDEFNNEKKEFLDVYHSVKNEYRKAIEAGRFASFEKVQNDATKYIELSYEDENGFYIERRFYW